MTRLALISFGAPVLALAALAGLDAFTAPRVSQGRLHIALLSMDFDTMC